MQVVIVIINNLAIKLLLLEKIRVENIFNFNEVYPKIVSLFWKVKCITFIGSNLHI